MGEDLARPQTAPIRRLVYAWAIVGVLTLLAQGLIKLVPVAARAVQGPLSPVEAGILWSFVAVNLYLEGYRGFQLRFVPRVIARALHLAHARRISVGFALLAPFFAMGFFHATRRARLSAWLLSSLIALSVILVRHLPDPWRGVVDAGVVAGLGYGTVVFVYQAIEAAFTGTPRAAAELPETAANSAEAATAAVAQPSRLLAVGKTESETG